MSPDQYANICKLVAKARSDLGLNPSEPLKFSSRARPRHVDANAWTDAKKKVLAGASSLGLQFHCIYVHNSIAKSDEKVHFAVDALCVAFNEALTRINGHGLVVIDHTSNVDREDFAEIASGVMRVSIFENKLSSIGGVSVGHVEWVLPLQLTDVVLGALRYCLEKPDHEVSINIYRDFRGLEMMLEQRPRTIKVWAYQADCDRLRADLDALEARANQG